MHNNLPTEITETLKQLEKAEGIEKIDLLNSLALYFLDKNTKLAIEYSELSKNLSDELKDDERLGNCLLLLGRGYFNSNNFLTALQLFANAQAIFEKLQDKEKESEALMRTGRCQNVFGDNTRSLETLFRVVKLCREMGNMRRESEALLELSVCYLANKEYELALEYLDNAQEICLKACGKKELASVFGSKGNVYLSMSEFEKAYEYFKRCLVIFEDIDFPQSVGATYHNLGIVLCGLKQYDKALESTNKGLEILTQLDKKESAFRVLGTLGTIYKEKEEYDTSLEYFFKAFELANEFNFRHGIENMYKETAEVYQFKGDYQNAFEYISKKHIAETTRLENFSKFNTKYLNVAHKVDTFKKESEMLADKNLELSELNQQLNLKNNNLSDTLDTLHAQSAEIERINNINTKILSILAHDLKNPLGVIQQVTEMYIEKSIEPEVMEEIFNELKKNAGAALNMLNEVLQWGTAQVEKKKTADFTEINLYELIQKKEDEYSLLLKSKNNKLKNLCAKNFHLKADVNMIRFILRNLIINANKFTKDGTISIVVNDIPDFVEIIVTDTGVGMKPSQINRLFHWETRQSLEGTSGEKGTGLGLLICNEFVQNHQGKISVESEIGKGSSFHFTISKSL